MNSRKNVFISDLRDISERRYGVSVKYYSGVAERPHKRIDYEAEINLEQLEAGWLMSLNKTNVFFNQHEPDTISERLGSIVSKALYPVQTIIDAWGKQISGIENQQDIVKRWQLHKQSITDKYEGNVVEDFIKAVDKKLANSSLINRQMQYDLFWNLFFHPKYMAYTAAYKVPMQMYLSVVPYKTPICFKGEQEIIPKVTDYGSVQIHFTSEEQEASPVVMPGKKDEKGCFMKLNVQFDVDEKHYFAMHTRAIFEVYRREGEHTIYPIRKVQFTMFRL